VDEALTTLYAVELNKEKSFNDIILERDVLQIVNTIKATGKSWSNVGHIVDGIKMELSQLRSRIIEYVKRDANTEAHIITKKAISSVINRV
jgi:hypothetical protein